MKGFGQSKTQKSTLIENLNKQNKHNIFWLYDDWILPWKVTQASTFRTSTKSLLLHRVDPDVGIIHYPNLFFMLL